MKRLLIIGLALWLGGCTKELAEFKTLYSLATTTSVSPAVLIAAANSFDVIEGTATQYLIFCKGNLSTPACSASNRRIVIAYTRSGRSARNQAETYINSQTNAPSAIYNTLIAAINQLNSSPASKGASQ